MSDSKLNSFRNICEDFAQIAIPISNFEDSHSPSDRKEINDKWQEWLKAASLYFERFEE